MERKSGKTLKKKKITDADVGNFAALLTAWSMSETSFFLKQFWESVGMSEMQFYKRVWMSQIKIDDFNLDAIKRNLKKNRTIRDSKRSYLKGNIKRINVDFSENGESRVMNLTKEEKKEC